MRADALRILSKWSL